MSFIAVARARRRTGTSTGGRRLFANVQREKCRAGRYARAAERAPQDLAATAAPEGRGAAGKSSGRLPRRSENHAN